MEHTLETLEVYLMAEEFSDPIWALVQQRDFFTRDTIGKQLVGAADSISANIAEGYGRYCYKESKQFYFYAWGSIQEAKSWLPKCKRLNIVKVEEADAFLQQANTLLFKLNTYIKFVRCSRHSKSGSTVLSNS